MKSRLQFVLLGLLLGAAVLLGGVGSADDRGQGLLAAYDLDGDARDSAGGNRHGTLKGTATPTADRYGAAGKALQFDGRSHIELPLDINPGVLPQLTFTAWVRADEVGPIRQVMSHDDGGFDRSLGIDHRGGGSGWSAFAGSGGVVGFKPVQKGRWTFVAAVWDQAAGTVRLHIDDEVFERRGQTGGSGFKVNLARNPGFGEFFSGALDDVRFYGRALSRDEIALIQSGLSPDRGAAGGGRDYTSPGVTPAAPAAPGGAQGGRDDTSRDLAPDAPIAAPAPRSGALGGILHVRVGGPDAAGKAGPLQNVTVHLNARHAATDATGVAVFDGAPGGRHVVRVRQAGYEVAERSVDVPAGGRAEVDVPLVRVVSVDWRGSVRAATPDQPVAGAQIRVEPVEVKAALQGGGLATSDWDGNFEFVQLAPGRYRMSVEAPGFAPLAREVAVAEGAPPVFTLQPQSSPARLDVSVSESVTDRPLAKAKLTLAESWPNGMVAEATTDARGAAALTGLTTGAVNWVQGNGRVGMARRQLSLRIEADGHEPAVVPVTLGAAVAVKLHPLTVQPEVEPNDLGAPQDIRTGAPVRFSIEKNDDRDAFRFRLAQPARVVVKVGPDNPLETHLRIYDAQAKMIVESGAYAGRDNVIELRLEAGVYVAEVQEWGGNNSAPGKSITLTVTVDPAVDPSEPNNAPAQATPLRAMQQAAGLIFPLGDLDTYRVEVGRPGLMRIREPGMGLERHVRILRADGSLLAEQGAYAGRPIDLQVQVAPGTHFVVIGEWGNNNAGLEPYRLQVDQLPDDGIDDPLGEPGPMRAVRELPVGTTVHATLMPTGDRDLYRVQIPGAGTLRLQADGRPERHMQLFDQEGRQLADAGAYANRPVSLAWDFAGPQTVFVGLREWGDNGNAAAAHALAAWFEPADETDFRARNEDFDHATPLAVGDTARGSYLPRGDRDVYVVEVDRPGYLRARATSAHETHLRIFDARRQQIVDTGAYAGRTAEIAPAVGPGTYYVMIGEWGDNGSSPAPYELVVVLERVEPAETWPLATDPVRRLKEGEAQSFAIDHRGDVDRFVFEAGRPARWMLNVNGPLETLVRVYDDQTGTLLHESGHYAPARGRIPLELKNPARLRIHLSEWGDNNASLQAGFVSISARDEPQVADRVLAEADPAQPMRVSFRREAVPGTNRPGACEVDLDQDGRPELRLDNDQPRVHAFRAPGLFLAQVNCVGGEQPSRQRFWVQPTWPLERRGVVVTLAQPGEGQVVDAPLPVRVQAMSYDGRAVNRVRFEVDGRVFAEDHGTPFEAALPWQDLGPGEHRLKVTAWDTAGTSAEVSRRFSMSEYFGLMPADGAVLSGESVRVNWTSGTFGPSQVRYRRKGSDAWQEAVGQSGRAHQVVLQGLEHGVAYEVQPLGGREAGPVRTVTRVKGLSFTQAKFAADLRRDYDQRVAIGVRNNGDKPLKVRLECGRPADPAMLVSFVGEGSEDRPIDLGPGEARQFVLGLSTQDVTRADHVVPVRIVSDAGLSDEAEVAVHVRLPRVELVWSDVGPAPDGRGRVLRLTNRGDPVTDLAVVPAEAGKVSIMPTVRHGLLPAGQSMDFTVSPLFREGYTGVATRIVASSLDKAVEQAFSHRLGAGESVRRVWLFPGIDPASAAARSAEPGLIANAERAARLRAETVNWTARPNPEDTDGDGRADRWSQLIDGVLWVGDDADGDERVDFVHADVGDDGVFEYSALLENGRWEPTNLVEAWLEMGFALPWNRDAYHPHDADIVLNDTVIGSLRNTVPEGNYTFRIPPRALRFDASGAPGANQVGIRSKHLRGGHYVVNSDFRFKFRLTATPVWTVARNEAEARTSVTKMAGVTVSAPDFSVTSAQLRLSGPAQPNAGDDMVLEVPLRNLGATEGLNVPVVVSRTLPGGGRDELARIQVARIGLDRPVTVRIPFKARGGGNTLTVTVDPDDAFGDLDRVNNAGVVFMQAAGETIAPVLKVSQPADGQVLRATIVPLVASATDDQGIASLALSVDGGLWADLGARDGSADRLLLLQPGTHRLEVRATDFSGNVASRVLAVKVEAATPPLRLVAPAEGTRVEGRDVDVVVEAPAESPVVAARSGGGNWYVGTREGGRVRIRLPVAFGAQAVEVMVAGRDGAVSRARVQVTGVRQPTEGEITLPPVGGQGMLWPAAHPTLALDLFRGVDGVLVPTAPQALEDWLRRREEAVRAVQAQAAATPVATPAVAAAPPVPATPVPQGPIPPTATAPGQAAAPVAAPAAAGAAGAAVMLLDIDNVYAVSSKPTRPSVLSLEQTTRVLSLRTYHWNGGRGAPPGTIALRDATGVIHGPWPAAGSPGQGGARDVYWTAAPNVVLPPGRYEVVDSAPESWSHNTHSQGAGFVRIEGQFVGQAVAAPAAPAVPAAATAPAAPAATPQPPAATSAAPAPSPTPATPDAKDDLRKSVEELRKSLKSLRDLFKK